jgi:hypothetical protein
MSDDGFAIVPRPRPWKRALDDQLLTALKQTVDSPRKAVRLDFSGVSFADRRRFAMRLQAQIRRRQYGWRLRTLRRDDALYLWAERIDRIDYARKVAPREKTAPGTDDPARPQDGLDRLFAKQTFR